MNDVVMDESKVFDACALVEEICHLRDMTVIKMKAEKAAQLLNQALEESDHIN